MTTLCDADIKAKVSVGELIHGADIANIGPACYELSMGAVYYDLSEGDRRIEASQFGNVLIKPGHRVVLITQEELKIPLNMIARVTSKGSLFSIGLSPVCTYADPGFSGNIGIVTQNCSDKYIQIPIGEPIAKVDFSMLSNDAVKPYRGQHGFQTQIWPIKHHLQKVYDEVKNDSRVGSEEDEAYKMLPAATAGALRVLQRKQRVIDISILVAIVLNTLILAAISSNYIEPITAVWTNLSSSAIVGIVMWISKT